MSDSLIPTVPPDIASARIGSCYNQLTRTIVEDAWAIDPAKLGDGTVKWYAGGGKMIVTANSSSAANACDTVFSLDSKASGGYDGGAVGVNASVAFHMQTADSASRQSEELNVYCSYAFTGQRQVLQRAVDANHLIDWMTETFQVKYKAVIDAATPEAYLAAYLDFVEYFGHGCVTTLYLAATSAFRLTLKRTDDATASRRKYGASASFSGRYGAGYGGASVATEWAQDQQAADSRARLEIAANSLPADAPTQDWANSMLITFASQTIYDLTKAVSPIKPPENVKEPEAPAVPAGVPYQSGITGNSHVDPNHEAVGQGLRENLMSKDGFTGNWNEYVQKQNAVHKTINPRSVVAEGTL